MNPPEAGVKSVRRFGNRWPPFRAFVKATHTQTNILNRGRALGLQVIAFGAALVIGGLGLLAIGLSPSTPAPLELWLPLFATGTFVFGAGLWLCRYREECFIDIEAQVVRFRIGHAFGVKSWNVDSKNVRAFIHAVEFERHPPMPRWKGFALCLWKNEEMVMVVAIDKDVSVCQRMLHDGGLALQSLFHGEGCIILAQM